MNIDINRINLDKFCNFEDIFKLLCIFVKQALVEKLLFQMPQEYHELPEQVQQNILTCLKVRREHLTNALLRKHYKQKLPTVIDLDWRLKVL